MSIKAQQRKRILERDNHTCQRCKKEFDKNKLVAHHLLPKDFRLNEDDNSLITLCKSCHKNLHIFLAQLENYFGKYNLYACPPIGVIPKQNEQKINDAMRRLSFLKIKTLKDLIWK